MKGKPQMRKGRDYTRRKATRRKGKERKGGDKEKRCIKGEGKKGEQKERYKNVRDDETSGEGESTRRTGTGRKAT